MVNLVDFIIAIQSDKINNTVDLLSFRPFQLNNLKFKYNYNSDLTPLYNRDVQQEDNNRRSLRDYLLRYKTNSRELLTVGEDVCLINQQEKKEDKKDQE